MPRCAFLSMNGLQDFVSYDRLASPHLAELGWTVEEVPWRSPEDWSRFDLVVIRSTWDYQDDHAAFLEVLEEIDGASHLENSLETCRWNVEKTYLRDLEAAGVPIVPTVWLPAGELFDRSLAERLAATLPGRADGSAEIVVKPVVGANADFARRLHLDDLVTASGGLERDFAERAAMVQPFVSGVVTEGEHSLFFFDGEYSHSVLKTPKRGDFRVQEEHGGTIVATEAAPGALAVGRLALDALPRLGQLRGAGGRPLYARVDVVRREDGAACWQLMELELVEPSLYFPYGEGSARRFAEACHRRAAIRREPSRGRRSDAGP